MYVNHLISTSLDLPIDESGVHQTNVYVFSEVVSPDASDAMIGRLSFRLAVARYNRIFR